MSLLLIEQENEYPKEAIVIIIEDHRKHLKSHIFHMYKPWMIVHIFRHLIIAYRKHREGLPTIDL